MRRLSFLSYATASSIAIAGLFAAAATASQSRAELIKARASRVAVSASCPISTVSPGCTINWRLPTTAGDHYKAGVVVGGARTILAPGRHGRMTVTLTKLGRRLLGKRRPLPLRVTTSIDTRTPPGPPTTTIGALTTGAATTSPGTTAAPGPAATTPATTTPAPAPTTTVTVTEGLSSTGTPITGTMVAPAGEDPPAPCRAVAPAVLPSGGPGPSAVLGGIYVSGGPPPFPCVGTPAPTPADAGTVQVLDASGLVVQTVSVAAGETFEVDLPPGTYTMQASTSSYTLVWQGSTVAWPCGTQPFTVTAGSQTVEPVVCNVP